MKARLVTFSVFIALFIALSPAHAQKKADRKAAKQLQADISYLASDELEGRRTSYEGERKAAEYIEKRYREAKIQPYKNQYRYPFHFVHGKEISGATQIRIDNMLMRTNEDAFPLPFSASRHIASEVLPEIMEQGDIWLLPLYTDKDQANDPHFDAEKYMFDKGREAAKAGASAVVFYDGYGSKYPVTFNKQSIYEPLSIPVVFVSYGAYDKHIKSGDAGMAATGNQKGIAIAMDVAVIKAERTGNNVAAYIDNHAPYTVVIGAHYDHLGYGEDGNSLFSNAEKEHQIHHGADDNASGTAGLLEMARWIKAKKLRHYNYLFINFSGEELGLYGSKAFIKDQQLDSSHIAYMINMDMIGRLNDSTHALTLGGVGTSPAWAQFVDPADTRFKLIIDSSGVGPSDHTSFYNAGIPVLFFFTGQHKDYHKPSDRPEFINYPGEVSVLKYVEQIVAKMDKEHTKPLYTVTRQKSMGRSSFKVTLGIMPDYTFQEGGVRVDGITDNRPAQRAGILQGDIIVKLGDNNVTGMQTYMEALGKFGPGDKTVVTVLRSGKELKLPIELTGK